MPTTALEGCTVHLPGNGSGGLDQDEEWCELEDSSGERRRIRFHDYADIYAVPGLYEHLFGELLDCDSPRVIAGLLGDEFEQWNVDPEKTSVLDFGAGNGMVGEQLQELGVDKIVGVDLLEEAKDAALRDRPEVYDDYYALDLTQLGDEHREELSDYEFDCMTCVAALGFGDIPALAFAEAYNLVSSPGRIAFNLRDKFFEEHDTTGFGQLLARMKDEGLIEETKRVRYRHRKAVNGDSLHYLAVVAVKHGDLPLEWLD